MKPNTLRSIGTALWVSGGIHTVLSGNVFVGCLTIAAGGLFATAQYIEGRT